MAQFSDYYVRPMDEQDIESIACLWRAEAVKALTSDPFNIVNFIKKVIQRRPGRKGKLRMRFLPVDTPGSLAKVSFDPLALSVRVDVWADARDREDGYANYVLAHECGHIVLHDHEAKGFSAGSAARIPKSEILRSAEWQADCFADHFLAPMHLVERYDDPHQLAIRCGIERQVAERRMSTVRDYWSQKGVLFQSDPCERCLCSEMRRIGTRLRCSTCGKMASINL